MATTRNHGGIIHRSLQPGSFYRCAGVGSFIDSSCNVEVPGCSAVLNRQYQTIEQLRLPDHVVQIPHAKMSVKFGKHPQDAVEWIEMPFGDYDPQGIGEALQMAADSGLIVEVDDEEVKALWGECWTARKERIVFDPRELRTTPAESMIDLIERAKKDRLADARTATKQIHDEAANAAK